MHNQYDSKLSANYFEETKADLFFNNKAKLKQVLLKRAGIKNPKNWNILDIGCGGGFQLKFLDENFPEISSLTGVDLSPDLIKIAKEQNSSPKISYHVAHMDNMPFDDGVFDYILSINTIHYSRDLNKTFKEIARVMKKDAHFFFYDSHPIFGLFYKKSKDYGKKEDAVFPIQGGKAEVVHPTFMLQDYFQAISQSGLEIVSYKEYFGRRSLVGEFRIPVIQEFKLSR